MTGLRLARHFLGLRRRIPSATGGNWPRQERLYCELSFGDGATGYGEAAPHPVYGPNLDRLEREIRESRFFGTTANWPAALTLAMLDAWTRSAKVPLWEALGWAPPAAEGYGTVVTYGGSDPDQICEEVAAENPSGIKLKLTGTGTDLLVVREVWRAFHRPLVLDLNGSWGWEEAVQQLILLEAENLDVLWIEQPCHPAELRSKLPTRLRIFADEAVDHPAFEWSSYDGIVLKPAVLGLLSCARLGRLAKDRGKAVTLGCHLQSSLLTSASLCLGGFVSEKWVDLDSALLVEDDPFEPPLIDRTTGVIRASEGPGLATAPIGNLPWGA